MAISSGSAGSRSVSVIAGIVAISLLTVALSNFAGVLSNMLSPFGVLRLCLGKQCSSSVDRAKTNVEQLASAERQVVQKRSNFRSVFQLAAPGVPGGELTVKLNVRCLFFEVVDAFSSHLRESRPLVPVVEKETKMMIFCRNPLSLVLFVALESFLT